MSEPADQPQTFRKQLDDDCLLAGELHSSITERLSRVRELPVSSVANLRGVARDDKGVWLEWQFVAGTNLEQFLAETHSNGELEAVARELRSAVDSMHAHGIVHGAIHARNVIIDPRGRVRLTHVSPLLYSDPAVDDRAVLELSQRILPVTSRRSGDPRIVRDTDIWFRRWAYLLTIAALLAGALMFVLILWYIHD